MAGKNRIFISFAIEDRWARDFLVGQAKQEHSPFEFVDMSVKTPWDSSWKTNCRSRIKGCDGVIAILSANTATAEGARWEMKCAREEGIPIVGMQANASKPGAIPAELAGAKMISWTWSSIKSFLDHL